MVDLTVKIGSLELKNPITTASGTFGYGYEFEDFFDISTLGAIVVKATTAERREGNPYPRMCETPSGMINTVGLQNKGVDFFVNKTYPKIKDIDTNIIVNVSGSTLESYIEVAEKLNTLEKVDAIELNISCPNVKEGGITWGTNPKESYKITKAIRDVYKKTLIVKLTPNVTDITEIALAVEDAGADVISLINTIKAMGIDINTKRPYLSTITGGLSGPAIKPIALRMLWEVYNSVKVPIIGIGGICNYKDVIEFLLAGATAVQIGTANFINPNVCPEIINDLIEYCKNNKIEKISDLTGGLVI